MTSPFVRIGFGLAVVVLVGCQKQASESVFFVPISRHEPCVFVVATKLGKEIIAPRMVPCEYPSDK